MDRIKKLQFNLLSIMVYIVSPFMALPLLFYAMFKRLNSVPFFYALALSYISYLYIPPFSWDKTRHMEFYELSKLFSFAEFLTYNFEGQPDFLFRLLIYLGSIFDVRIHYIFFLITFITVYLIFIVYFKELRKLNNVKKYSILLIPLFICSLSYTDIISGMRYTLAVSFVFYGYYTGLVEKKKYAYIWLVLGIITHFSVLLFIVIYPIILLVNKKEDASWLRVLLLISFGFIFIPEGGLLNLFRSIGLGAAFDYKVNTYLNTSGELAEINNFADKFINFFNIAWVILLNIVLLLKKDSKNSSFTRLITTILLVTNIFASFPVIYNRYNLLLKLILVLYLMRAELNNNRYKTPVIFIMLLFVVYFNQLIVMRVVLIDMFSNLANWSFVYQIFDNNFGLNNVK